MKIHRSVVTALLLFAVCGFVLGKKGKGKGKSGSGSGSSGSSSSSEEDQCGQCEATQMPDESGQVDIEGKGCTILEDKRVINSKCNGCCPSSASNSPEAGGYMEECNCCRPTCLEKTKLTVQCPEEGTTRDYWYDLITRCECNAECSNGATEPSYPHTLSATCDDTMRVWIDGVEQTYITTGLTAWTIATTFPFSDCAQVIAIECIDVANVAMGLLASTSTGVVSDGSWKCWGDLQDGAVPNDWADVNFDDTAWNAANVFGGNPSSPWNTQVNGIGDGANWIGPGSKTDVGPLRPGPSIYCRYNL